WLGKELVALHRGKLCGIRLDRYRSRNGDALHPVRATMEQMDFVRRPIASNPGVHCVARRAFVSWAAAKLLVTGIEERPGRMVDGLCVVWVLSYHQHGVSELALRGSGDHRRGLLRMDLAKNGIHFRIRTRPRCRGHRVAL